MLLAAMTVTAAAVLFFVATAAIIWWLNRWSNRQQAMRTPLGDLQERVRRLEEAVFGS